MEFKTRNGIVYWAKNWGFDCKCCTSFLLLQHSQHKKCTSILSVNLR